MLKTSSIKTKTEVVNTSGVKIRQLGCQDYAAVWQEQKLFTQNRTTHTTDEIWFLEHWPVFTQGQAGKPEHLLNAGDIALVQSDRGGQITYHGPGQLVVYFLVDLQRKKIAIRQFVTVLEQTIVDLLAEYFITAVANSDAHGVYIDGAKICSLGLRVKHGCTYHGLSLNVAMDLTPFKQINPCGFAAMRMTQLSEYIADITLEEVMEKLLPILQVKLAYTEVLM